MKRNNPRLFLKIFPLLAVVFLCRPSALQAQAEVGVSTRAAALERWNKMAPEERAALRERYERWKAMPPDQQKEMRARWQRFKQLPPEQRKEIQERWQRYKKMSPEDRAATKARLNAWRALPPEERQRRLDRYRQRSASGQRARPRSNTAGKKPPSR